MILGIPFGIFHDHGDYFDQGEFIVFFRKFFEDEFGHQVIFTVFFHVLEEKFPFNLGRNLGIDGGINQ